MRERLSLAIRGLLPEWLKRPLRAARLAVVPPPPFSAPVPQAALDGCTLVTDRLELLRRLPKGGRVVELGTQHGNFARAILDLAAPDELHLVDLDLGVLRQDVRADPRVTLHPMSTVAFLERHRGAGVDWIYVDADHSYRGVRRDLELAQHVIRHDGILVLNDFARIVRTGLGEFGVHQATCEFVAQGGWRFVYFALDRDALYDVALTRMAPPG